MNNSTTLLQYITEETGLDKNLVVQRIAMYLEPGRFYHTAQHLWECFCEFEANYRELCNAPNEVAIALLYHDCIYHPKSIRNEIDSANLAEHEVSAGTLSKFRITSMILSTDYNRPTEATNDINIVNDIDLSIFAAPIERYREYADQVRLEYQFVPWKVYREERIKILYKFLDMQRIYKIELKNDPYKERRAKSNILAEINRLKGL